MGRHVKYHEDWNEPVDWQPNSADGFYFPLDFYGGTLRGMHELMAEFEVQVVGTGVVVQTEKPVKKRIDGIHSLMVLTEVNEEDASARVIPSDWVRE